LSAATRFGRADRAMAMNNSVARIATPFENKALVLGHTTFLMYIQFHEQIVAFSFGISKRMSRNIPFINLPPPKSNYLNASTNQSYYCSFTYYYFPSSAAPVGPL
jgi:hypothetical protein